MCVLTFILHFVLKIITAEESVLLVRLQVNTIHSVNLTFSVDDISNYIFHQIISKLYQILQIIFLC